MSDALKTYDDNYNEDSIRCPYCDNIHKDTNEMINVDGKEAEIECESCEKKFLCYAEPTITYHSIPDCLLIGEEHIFTDEPISGSAWCERCRKYVRTEK